MTLDELRGHIRAVVDYNMADELADAKENGREGHVVNSLIALDDFLGAEWDHSEADPEPEDAE